MKLSFAAPLTAMTLLASALFTSIPAMADVPGAHPAYVHGVRDLRIARGLLRGSEMPNVSREEALARRDVDRAMNDAYNASAIDQKNMRTPVSLDVNLNEHDRLVRAFVALRAAHRDFTEFESDGGALGWRHAAVVEVDRAAAHVRRALRARNWDARY